MWKYNVAAAGATLIGAIVFLMVTMSTLPGKKPERPNIIFIFTDDHANRTISAYGNAINHTPNIDRIADEGALFVNSFCTNSICGPSRATILTGKHSHKNGVTGNGSRWDGSQLLFPRVMKNAGYRTVLFGKWHLNSNPGDEFDYWKILQGAGRQGFYYNPEFETSDGKTFTEEGYSTDLTTDHAIQWLDENAKREKPFVLFVQYKAPHVPRMPHFRHLGKYKNDTIPEPETLFDDYSTRERYASEAKMPVNYRPLPLLEDHDPSKDIYYARMSREQLELWHKYKDEETKVYHNLKSEGKLEGDNMKRYAYQQFIKDYLRCVDAVDENVGRLLSWLDLNKKVKRNTIVVYSSDQSYFTGEHGWAEKRFMYEQGMRMPLIMSWPGVIKPGTKVDALVQNIDYAPTFLAAAGIQVPAEMQGQSLIPLIKDRGADWRKSVYYHYYDHGDHGVPRHDGVRNNRYKLISFYTDDKWELYDLEKDPNEVNNVYNAAEYSDIVGQMKKELIRLRKHYDVPENSFMPPYVPKRN